MEQIGASAGRAGIAIMFSYFLCLTGGPLWAETGNPCQGKEIQMGKGTSGNEAKTRSGGSTNKAGLRLVDPETGEMVAVPVPGTIPQKMVESMDTSDVGLYEEPDAAGGTMVDLQGRFRPMLKVPQASHENVQSDCPGK